MSNGMTSTSSLEVEQYCDAVRAALVDLPGELGDDLLDDLPYHLTEVLAEGEGSLRERLGEPTVYAEELRAAAGLEPVAADFAAGGARTGLADIAARVTDFAGRVDVRVGSLVGYPRLVDLLRALRPGWWVLRGWIIALFTCGVHDRSSWNGLTPSLGSSALAGFCITVVAVAASVWFGGRSPRFTRWPRRAIAVGNAVIAVWALTALASGGGATTTYYVDPAAGSYSPPFDVSDVYVYDQNGNRVDGARLFDQNGNPIQVGSGTCQDGNPAPGAETGADGTARAWTYPLCPGDPGPFRSGPGAVRTASPTSTPSAPTSSPRATPTSTRTARPKATTSTTR
ncbi:MAG: hypothetical protein DLM57_05135 [Pseudonocardiales bacterium]|nr:MAG: hypothetical protein DLM57_05135 [Pseudonocardiales bacterium]